MKQPGGLSRLPQLSQPEPARQSDYVTRPAPAPWHQWFYRFALDMYCVLDPSGRLIDANDAFAQTVDIPQHDLAGRSIIDLSHAADRQTIAQELALLGGNVETICFEGRFCCANAAFRWMLWSITRDPEGGLAYALVRDIQAQKAGEAALAESERRFAQLTATVLDAIYVLDLAQRRLTFFNRDELFGYSCGDLDRPEDLTRLVHPDDYAAVTEHLRRLATAGPGAPGRDALDYRIYRKDNGLEWVHSRAAVFCRDEHGAPQQLLFMLTTITDRKHAEQLLAYQAHYDAVTGLPNRFRFAERLEETIAAARGGAGDFAVCFIDLDRFNQINDTLGHAIGDEVLAAVAMRLRGAIGLNDTLARMGGDEFTLIIADAHSEAAALRAASQIQAALKAPFLIAGHELFLSASVGIGLYPRDGEDLTTLLKHADSAMYRAKARGRNSVSWFEPALGAAALARLTINNQLRRAIDHDQLELFYQPQIDLQRRRVIGVEALLRWHHPERGMILPGEFIPVAEENHLMPQLSAWVLHAACRQIVAWQRAGQPPLRVAVNVSALQFERDDLIAQAAQLLRTYSLPAGSLDLEITESVLMRDPDGSALRIEQLRTLGVRIALDDFGTGYSSLAYLQRFPVDILKIDRSFIAALGTNLRHHSSSAALVDAIVALAHSLGLTVVAEGVETVDQHELICAMGCDEAQGYHYARPMPAAQLWGVIDRIRL